MKKFLSMMFLSLSFLANGQLKDLERIELILFTTPYCEICPNLKRLIRKKGYKESISYNYGGKLHYIPFKTIDPYSISKKNLRLLEYEKIPSLPYLAVYKSGFFSQKFLIKGRPLGRFDQRDLKLLKLKVLSLGKSFFQIKKGESIEDFQERIDDVFLLNFPSLQSFIAEALRHKTPPSLQKIDTSLGLEIGTPLDLSGKNISINVIYIGNADTPINNPLFTPIVLKTIQKGLSNNLGFDNQKQGIILFGSGQKKLRDVLKMEKEDEYVLVSHSFSKNINGSFNRRNVKELFSHLKESKKGLFIMVGHGAQDGALLWFEKERLGKSELKKLHLSTKAQNIIVSGTCYGGQFYDALSCGFFGAHPKTPAIGCWSSENQIISKKDYTRTFFSSLEEGKRKEADLNGDGKLSFQEMHWYASLQGPKEDLPFTSLDGLARLFFKKHPSFLQQKNSIEDLLTYANPGEKYVLKRLKKDLDKKNIIMEEVKEVQFKVGGETFKIKLDVLNPLSSQLIFRFTQKERELILSILKRKISHDFKKGIKKVSFQKFGKKIFFKVFFKTGKKIRFYDDFQMDKSGDLVSDFFKIKLTAKEKNILKDNRSEKVFSKNFIIFPEIIESLKNEYLQLEFIEEFIRTSKNGKKLSIGIKYKDAHDPWPKIHILKTINNILPKYRLLMPQLMKRLLFKKLVVNYPNYFSQFQSFKKCENQSIEDFLRNK